MPRVGLYLTDPQTKKMKEISKKTGLTVSDLIRRSLDDWLERYEEKERKKGGKR
jgi:Arc/MetJ-type ribon-helix-helix transcriptional regulator